MKRFVIDSVIFCYVALLFSSCVGAFYLAEFPVILEVILGAWSIFSFFLFTVLMQRKYFLDAMESVGSSVLKRRILPLSLLGDLRDSHAQNFFWRLEKMHTPLNISAVGLLLLYMFISALRFFLPIDDAQLLKVSDSISLGFDSYGYTRNATTPYSLFHFYSFAYQCAFFLIALEIYWIGKIIGHGTDFSKKVAVISLSIAAGVLIVLLSNGVSFVKGFWPVGKGLSFFGQGFDTALLYRLVHEPNGVLLSAFQIRLFESGVIGTLVLYMAGFIFAGLIMLRTYRDSLSFVAFSFCMSCLLLLVYMDIFFTFKPSLLAVYMPVIAFLSIVSTGKNIRRRRSYILYQ